MLTISSDLREDHSLRFLWDTDDECCIDLCDLFVSKLSLELLHGFVVFGDDDESARLFVQTMDDTWSLDTIDH